MLAIYVIIPLLISALVALFSGSAEARYVKYIALIASLASLAITASLFIAPAQVQNIPWFSFHNSLFNISTSTMPLNMLMLSIVSLITPLIFLYSVGFMEVPSEQRRYYFEMSIFAASMMLFAISANFITMFIAWEMLGITSYLLIGFWYAREKAPTAARKAITTILIGDIAMLAAIILIFVTFNSLDFSTILQAAAPYPIPFDIALVLILVAAFTKSAQFPFHEWLSDAMEGPTPVSAFLHSSTMVKAGVFIIAVLLPLYANAGLLNILVIIGIVTAILGATNALAERHIKKILAYSTIEDLGLMFVALGFNALYAAMLLFVVQAFYKALLFMDAGAIMMANDDEEDIFKIYNSSSHKGIYITMIVGVLSIAGIFPLSGFFGKAVVASSATNMLVYALLLVVGLLSSIYIFRWLYVPTRKSATSNAKIDAKYNTTPITMMIPAYILALLVLVAALSYLYLPGYLGTLAKSYSPLSIIEIAVENVIAIAGLLVAYYIYKKGNRNYVASTHKNLQVLLYNNKITNSVYMYVVKAIAAMSDAIGWFDFQFDKATYSLTELVMGFSSIVKTVVNGQTNTYVLVLIVGLAVLMIIFVL